MELIIKHEFDEHIKTASNSIDSISEDLEIAAKMCIDCLKKNGKILIFGNGGSAADAQHIAAELVSRYKTERKALGAIALTTDSSILSAIANDDGYEKVFSRQIEALANSGDIAIGISTGGTSENVIKALKTANEKKCKTIGFSGRDGGEFNEVCNVNIVVPAIDTPRIQEMHILIGHTICHLIDQAFESN
jgi:D-sedoheptulose 7-phosphate isomerase